MKFTKTSIEGLMIIEPRVFGDEKGYFLGSYNEKEFEEVIGKVSFDQELGIDGWEKMLNKAEKIESLYD